MRPRRGVTARDGALFALLCLVLIALHWPVLFGGRVYFSDDITHISFPWRALACEALQKGRLPFWNPYACLGLPFLANIQNGIFYPPSILFHCFPYARALGWFVVLNYALGGLWTMLWLKNWGFGSWPAFAGATIFTLGGTVVAHLQFTNLIATLIHMPAIFLFAGLMLETGLLSALAFLAGYPPIWIGMGLCLGLTWLWPKEIAAVGDFKVGAPRSAMGLCLGLALSMMVLGPLWQFVRISSRGRGFTAQEWMLGLSLKPEELAAFIHPELARQLSFRLQQPHEKREDVIWTPYSGGAPKKFTFYSRYVETMRDSSGVKYITWKSCYAGFVGSALILLGWIRLLFLKPLRAAAFLGAGIFVGLLLLGERCPASQWLWMRIIPLHYIRGPARLNYLFLAGFVPLAAGGVEALGRRVILQALASLALLMELSGLARGFYPTLPADYYRDKGPLVEFLQRNLGQARYYQFPSTQLWPYVNKEDPSEDYQAFKEMVYRTYKQKLFGVSGGVFHLAALSGAFETLIPAESMRVMDFFDKAQNERGGQARLMPYLKWAGTRYFLDRRPIEGPYRYRGLHLWHVFETPEEVSRAFWLPSRAQARIVGPFASAPKTMEGKAWQEDRPREDSIIVRGVAKRAGLLYLAEPLYPGWSAYINGQKTEVRRALGAFMYMPVTPGAVEAVLRFRPTAWAMLVWASLAAWGIVAAEGVRSLRKFL